jgi:hypothetical protein
MQDKYDGKIICKDKRKDVRVYVDKARSDETMSLFEMSRWVSLMEAMSVIDGHLNTNKTSVSNWVKPIAIQKYIDERSPIVMHELAVEKDISEVFVPCTI